VGQRAHGARAQRSNGGEQDGVDGASLFVARKAHRASPQSLIASSPKRLITPLEQLRARAAVYMQDYNGYLALDEAEPLSRDSAAGLSQ